MVQSGQHFIWDFWELTNDFSRRRDKNEYDNIFLEGGLYDVIVGVKINEMDIIHKFMIIEGSVPVECRNVKNRRRII